MDRINKLQEFLAASPADPFLQHALALEYVKRGEEAKAKALFQNILAADETYIGSYYHLAKLLERIEETNNAIAVYEKGMQEAKKAGDNHAYSELRAAYEDLTF